MVIALSGKSIKKYIVPFLAAFAALALLIRPRDVGKLLSAAAYALSPFVMGIILAAVIDPAVCRSERFFSQRLHIKKFARGAAIAAVYVLIAGITSAAAVMILPKLWESGALFVSSADGYYSDFRRRYADGSHSVMIKLLDSLAEQAALKLPSFFERTFQVTAGFLRSAGSFLVGAVLSVYILAQKDDILQFVSSAARAAMSEKAYKKTARVLSAVNSCLVSFIAGQLSEAVLLGTLCFGGMVLFGFEYPLLISSIIAVTALVPVAGAIAGAVPSALILFLVKPSSALWFIVFIVILQQLENNFIYPRVVGKSVGLPPILILAAIIIGAELWGAAGIMLGIPLVSAAYMLLREKIESGREARREISDH